jgi:hypothetical protein
MRHTLEQTWNKLIDFYTRVPTDECSVWRQLSKLAHKVDPAKAVDFSGEEMW